MRKTGMVLMLVFWAGSSHALNVVVTIPPLAAMVMPLLDEEDQLTVLLTPGASPHGFQLKPSHVQAIKQADLVVTVGTGADAWVRQALRHYDGVAVSMNDLPGLVKLEKREGGVWQAHPQRAAHQEGSNQKRMDGHVWLGLDNARSLISAMSARLQQMRPSDAVQIQARETAVLHTLSERDQAWQTRLQPYQSQRFIVMHDAYQYFERQYNLQAAGTIHVNPELPPSAKRLDELRQEIAERNVRCVFKEPQFPEARLVALVRGLDVNVGQLDPLGFDGRIQPYADFYEQLVTAFVACFEAAE